MNMRIVNKHSTYSDCRHRFLAPPKFAHVRGNLGFRPYHLEFSIDWHVYHTPHLAAAGTLQTQAMGEEDLLTDEYVANLLAADAKQSTIKYSAMGLEAFAPSRHVTPTLNFACTSLLTVIDLLRTSRSQIHAFSAISLKTLIVTMQHCSQKRPRTRKRD